MTVQENTQNEEQSEAVETISLFKNYIYLFSIALSVIALDQWTKNWVRQNLAFGQVWDLLPDLRQYARILHWQNSGSAFGMFQNSNLPIMALAVVVTIIIIIYFPQVPKEDWALRAALSLQMGGAVGNLLDRIQFGHVTDFISVGNFPVWNVADMSISAGVGVLVIGLIIAEANERKMKKLEVTEIVNAEESTTTTEEITTGEYEIKDFQFEEDTPQRLDVYLATQLSDYSRARIQTLIKSGLVSVDGKIAKKTGVKLNGQHHIQIEIPPVRSSKLIPEDIPLDVLFENKDVIVINKPADMVVHPSVGHYSGTLVHAVLAHAPDITSIGGEKRPGLVHRLDKDTTGVIILAKNDLSLRALQAQFKNRKVGKHYIALVDGLPSTPEGRIEAPIGRDPKHRQRMTIIRNDKGREAISEYRTLERFENHTLLDVSILTGRTHQIRVHMAFIEVPIAADPTYGHRKVSIPLERQFLHAWQLTLVLPGETSPRTFEAPLPTELENILQELRKG